MRLELRNDRTASITHVNLHTSSSQQRDCLPFRGRPLVNFLVTSRLNAPQDLRNPWRAAMHRTSEYATDNTTLFTVRHQHAKADYSRTSFSKVYVGDSSERGNRVEPYAPL